MRAVAFRAIFVRTLLALAISFLFALQATATGTMPDHASVAVSGSAVSGHGPATKVSVRHASHGKSSCDGGMTCGHCAPLPTTAIAFLVLAKEIYGTADSESASSIFDIPHRPPNLA